MIKMSVPSTGSPWRGARASGLEESYQGLITAVIRQAVKDYVSVLLRLFSCPAGKKKAALEMEKAELEVFFHSDWFHTLTDMDGERLLLSARRLAMEKAKEAIAGSKKRSSRYGSNHDAPLTHIYAPCPTNVRQRKGNDDENRKKFAGGPDGAEPAESGKERLYRICAGAPPV